MKTTKTQILIVLFLIVVQHGFTQGFVNLNFESAHVSGYSPGDFLPTSAAFPGWIAYAPVIYDTTSLGGALVILVDSNAPSGGAPLPIQGNYSVLLEGSIPFAATSASIGQTGTIPITAQSLTFFANQGGLQVAFNGQNLPFSAIGTGANYTIYGADISSYAGQTGQLLFTTPVQAFALLDNIQFSTEAIPEPNGLVLFGLGALLLGFFRRCNSSR